jgi:hypothetical protein
MKAPRRLSEGSIKALYRHPLKALLRLYQGSIKALLRLY